MKKLSLIAIVLLAGCAATKTQTGGSDPRLMQLEEKSRIIAEREKQCIDTTLTRSRDEMARIAATPDASLGFRIQAENQERDRELSKCRARADQDNAEIAAHERAEYELRAQQEHDRSALIMTLTASGPH
jgi:hypothetical protein